MDLNSRWWLREDRNKTVGKIGRWARVQAMGQRKGEKDDASSLLYSPHKTPLDFVYGQNLEQA